jgi:hypothetical protein
MEGVDVARDHDAVLYCRLVILSNFAGIAWVEAVNYLRESNKTR